MQDAGHALMPEQQHRKDGDGHDEPPRAEPVEVKGDERNEDAEEKDAEA